MWRAREFTLRDFAVDNPKRKNGKPKWYADPLGERVFMDKAELYERVGYYPGAHQCAFHASLAKIKVFSGGARAGKSMVAGYDIAPILLTPGTQTWLVAPEYELAEKEFDYVRQFIMREEIWPYIKDHFSKKMGGRISWNPRSTGGCEIRAGWGPHMPPGTEFSWVRVRSSMRETKLLGEELDCLCLCEGANIPERQWERQLKMRLTTRDGITLIPSTPSGMDWTAKLYEKGLRGEPGHFAINADARMNPTANLESIRFHSKDMPEEVFNEQVRGIPTPKHGLVYKGFQPMSHVGFWQKDWPLPGWRVGRAIDFGYTDPFVVLWIAVDEDHNYYVFDEFYRKGVLVQDVIREIAKREGAELKTTDSSVRLVTDGAEIKPFMTITDWDSGQRKQLLQGGVFPARKANKEILPGILTVQSLFRYGDNGRPKLFISPACKELKKELLKYEWSDKDNAPKSGQADHALDALRYFVHTLRPSGMGTRVGRVRR